METQFLENIESQAPTFSSSRKGQLGQSQIKELEVTSIINQSRFSIYKAETPSKDVEVAMKMFPFFENDVHPSFYNEIQFAELDHPNIIKIMGIQNRRKIIVEDEKQYASCVFLEYTPFPDFADICQMIDFSVDLKLVRTIFLQLLDALTYLHKNGFAHMDVKPENILLGKDYLLRVIDFDFSMSLDQKESFDRGTPNYRAPEFKEKQIENPAACDVYSAGIFLFVLMTSNIPYLEGTEIAGKDMQKLLYDDFEQFWEVHEGLQEDEGVEMNKNFKNLFEKMTKKDPKDRIELTEIMDEEFLKGETYSVKEFQDIMSQFF